MQLSFDKFKELYNNGHFMEVRQNLEYFLKENPNHLSAQQLLALTMSKSGSLRSAIDLLEPVYHSNSEDPETTGIMAGIYKQMFRIHQNQEYGKKAYYTYLKNYELTNSPYTGINAASMSVMIGKASQGKEIAGQLITDIVLDDTDVWSLATLGEAYIIRKQRNEAMEFYLKARNLCGNQWGIVNSIYNQLWLLNHYIFIPSDILNLFKPPVIAAFSGHMIDLPGRQVPRFMNEMSDSVYEAIKSAIDTLEINIGYSSLASGADILFVEAMLNMGKDVRVTLPFKRDDFIALSVRGAGDDWVNRFYEIEKKINIEYLSLQEFRGDQQFFQYLGQVLYGEAIIHARRLNSIPKLLTVLSSYEFSNLTGGTRNMQSFWPYKDRVFNVNIDNIRKRFDEKPTKGSYEPDVNLLDFSERFIQNILSFKINTTNSRSVPKDLISHLEMLKSEFNEVITCQTEEFFRVLITGNSSVILMETAIDLYKRIFEHFESNVSMVLHFGPIVLTDYETCSHDCLHIEEIENMDLQNNIYITKPFVAVLNLDSERYKFENLGFLRLKNGLQTELFSFSSQTWNV